MALHKWYCNLSSFLCMPIFYIMPCPDSLLDLFQPCNPVSFSNHAYTAASHTLTHTRTCTHAGMHGRTHARTQTLAHIGSGSALYHKHYHTYIFACWSMCELSSAISRFGAPQVLAALTMGCIVCKCAGACELVGRRHSNLCLQRHGQYTRRSAGCQDCKPQH